MLPRMQPALNPREPHPCRCHRQARTRRDGGRYHQERSVEPGAWCSCMCPVHPSEEAEE